MYTAFLHQDLLPVKLVEMIYIDIPCKCRYGWYDDADADADADYYRKCNLNLNLATVKISLCPVCDKIKTFINIFSITAKTNQTLNFPQKPANVKRKKTKESVFCSRKKP